MEQLQTGSHPLLNISIHPWEHIKRKALDPQSTACIFVGYFDDVKGYRLIDPSTDKIFIERTVQFEEIPLHAPLDSYAETFVPLPTPHICDDESTHSDHD